MNFERLEFYFPQLDKRQKQQLRQMGELYAKWNQQINVISRKDMDHFYERHVLHSLGIAKVHSFVPHTKILDVGTGGGFPGIPLAILFPKASFHLVDSTGKKIGVVRDVIRELELKNVNAEQIRAEQVNGSYNFIVSRAVTQMKPFLQWVSRKFLTESLPGLPNGVLYLKGGDLTAELQAIKRPVKIFTLKNYFSEEFFETKKVVYARVQETKSWKK